MYLVACRDKYLSTGGIWDGVGCVTQNDDDAGDATLIIACSTVCLSLVVSALHQDSRLTRPFETLARSFGCLLLDP